MRISVTAVTLALVALAGCSAQQDSYATMTTGVGFGDYQRYLRERDNAPRTTAPYSVPPEARSAILPPASMPAAAPSTLDAVPLRERAPLPAPVPVAPIALAPATPLPPAPLAAPIAIQPLAAPMIAQAAAPQPAPAPVPRAVQASATFGTTPAFDAGPSVNPRISDEQDFAAVAARETIASDRERLAQQRQQYQVIEVASVPAPAEHAGPNIVAFALSVSHAPGTEVYRRLNPLRWAQWQSACLQFRTQDGAQEEFLTRGGPQRDPGNLDPDGDGYACWWDPMPLRQALATR